MTDWTWRATLMDVTQPPEYQGWSPGEAPPDPPAVPMPAPPRQYQQSYYQPYQQFPSQPQIIYTRPVPKSRNAVGSLVTGIVGMALSPCLIITAPYLFGAVSVAAVISGHFAFADIKRSNNTLGGRGLAIAGLLLGYPVVILWILTVIGMAVGQ